MTYPMWNSDKSGIIVKDEGGGFRFVDSGPEFEALKDVASYVERPAPDPMGAERAAMICTPAQMRLALHRMGLLAQVQAIADSDPEASIVWEYATKIVRNSPLIEALGADFTPEEIDDIFRAAMAVQT